MKSGIGRREERKGERGARGKLKEKRKMEEETRRERNKAAYTTALVAGGWAGAVMILAGAVMIWAGACSNINFSTLKMPKNAKKAKCDRRTDGQTDTVTYRSRSPRQKNGRG